MQLRQANPREQGDVGERLAAAWLAQAGYHPWIPFGHSPHVDLLAEEGEMLWRIQVKTSTPLFVLVSDGRMRFIPSEDVGGGSGLLLGGPKYADFEVRFGTHMGEAGFEPA